MSENSAIQWTDHTFNPWQGCSHAGTPGCDNCYARDIDKRFHGGQHWGRNSRRKFQSDNYWKQPLKWNARAAKRGIRERVFCGSMCDVFEQLSDRHTDRAAMTMARGQLWQLIEDTPSLDWLLLTKRPELVDHIASIASFGSRDVWPPNVWLGTTVENQAAADERIPHLLRVPARVRFLSCEPLLGPVDLRLGDHEAGYESNGPAGWVTTGNEIDWVIAGCESGPRARPADVEWLRSLRDQCQQAGVPFFLKQMKMGAELVKMPRLDGMVWDEVPQ